MLVEFAFDVPATARVLGIGRCEMYIGQLDDDLNARLLEMLAKVERLYCVATFADNRIVGESIWFDEDAIVSDLDGKH